MTTSPASSWRSAVIWAGIPLVIGAFNEFALSVALPDIRRELGLQLHDVRWLVLAFLIADAVVLIGAGRLGDRIGRRPVLMTGLAVVAVGSVAAALSPGFGWLVVARVVEGLGAGLMFSGVLAIVSDAVPPSVLGRAFGLWAFVGACAVLLSPIVGGLLTQYLSWRWIMVINAALSVAALLLTPRFLTSGAPGVPPPHSTRRLLHSPNFVAATVVTALIYAAVGLTWFTLSFHLFAVVALTPLGVGLVFASYGVWWLVLPPFTGRLADRVGVRVPVLTGLVLVLLGMLGLSVGAAAASLPTAVVAMSLTGIGVAFALPATNAAAFGQLDPDDRGEASGLNMTVRLIGSVLGLAVAAYLLEAVSGTAMPEFGVAGGLDLAAAWVWRVGAVLAVLAVIVTLAGVREVRASTATT